MSTISFSTFFPGEMKEILTSLRRLIIKSLEDNLLVEANGVDSLYNIAEDASTIIRYFDSKDTDDPNTRLRSVDEFIGESHNTLKRIEFYATSKGMYNIELDYPYTTNLISQLVYCNDEYSIEHCYYYPALMNNPYTGEPFVAIYRTTNYTEVEACEILDLYTAGVDYDFIKTFRDNGAFLYGYSPVEINDFYKYVANCHALVRDHPMSLKNLMSIFKYDTKEEALEKAHDLLYGEVKKLMLLNESASSDVKDNTSESKQKSDQDPEDTHSYTYLSPTM